MRIWFQQWNLFSFWFNFLTEKELMCRGSNVKDKMVTSFQLESLILAQNERWRQA